MLAKNIQVCILCAGSLQIYPSNEKYAHIVLM